MFRHRLFQQTLAKYQSIEHTTGTLTSIPFLLIPIVYLFYILLNKEVLDKAQIKFDDKVLLEGFIDFHDTSIEDILVGENKIGGYKATSKFLGTITR